MLILRQICFWLSEILESFAMRLNMLREVGVTLEGLE